MTPLELHFPASHPTGPGHFPGHPIIPGALLLAEVVRLMAQAGLVKADDCRIKSVKFLRPVRPGDTVKVEFDAAQSEIRFQCVCDAGKVMVGVLNV